MIPLNVGYRGSLIFSFTDTTAGRDLVTVATPLSVTRCTVTCDPLTSTFDASVSCGILSRSATIAGTRPVRASVDSQPNTTRSNPTNFSASASTSDDETASDP